MKLEEDHRALEANHRAREANHNGLSFCYQELMNRMNAAENELLVVKREKEKLQFELYNALPDIDEHQSNRQHQQMIGAKKSLTEMRQAVYCGPRFTVASLCDLKAPRPSAIPSKGFPTLETL